MKSTTTLRWMVLPIQTLLGAISLYYLFIWGHVDVGLIFQRFTIQSLFPFSAGVICFAIAMVLAAKRFHLYFSHSIPFKYLFGTTFFINALLTFIPWRIGEAGLPILLYKDYKIPVQKSVVTLLIVRAMDFLILLFIGLLGLRQLHLEIETWWILPVLFGLAVAGMTMLLFWEKKENKIKNFLSQSLQYIRFTLKPDNAVTMAILSVSFFVLTTSQSKFMFNTVGFDIHLFDVAFLNAITLIFSLLPIHPPGGWGTVDAMQVFVLGRLGYDQTIVIQSILIIHSVSTLLIFSGGIIGWVIRTKGLLRESSPN